VFPGLDLWKRNVCVNRRAVTCDTVICFPDFFTGVETREKEKNKEQWSCKGQFTHTMLFPCRAHAVSLPLLDFVIKVELRK
jgi:hypothetical protein